MNNPYLHLTINIALPDEAATAALAVALANISCAGDLIRLLGPMGAGKTTFTQYYLRALGWQGAVTSPTYTLLQTYATARFNVAHIDCYRLTSAAELAPLGLEEYRQFGIVLAEWAEKGGAALSAEGAINGGDLLPYHINSVENPGVLTLTLTGEGQIGENRSRVATLTGSPSWQRRFAMLPPLGVVPQQAVTRAKTEAGQRVFLNTLGLGPYTLASLGADWSSRSYARVSLSDGTTKMLMDSPPPAETTAEYIAVAAAYTAMGLRTAAIVAQDEAQGYLLTEDLGDRTLWHAMGAKGPAEGVPVVQTPWFAVAAEVLAVQVKAHAAGKSPSWARVYNRTDWWVEGARFTNWYMPFATGQATSLSDYAHWQNLLLPLYEILHETPSGLMQVDCQGPNAMLLGAQPTLANYALIDIQDARIAPVGQDAGLLVRNIRTARFDADEEAVVRVLCDALKLTEHAVRRSLAVGAFHHMVRILGGLTRLAVRDSRPGPAQSYLARTWEVAAQCAADPLVQPDLAAAWGFIEPHRQAGLMQLKTLEAAV